MELATPVTQIDIAGRGARVDGDDAEGHALRPLHDRHRLDRRAGVGAHQVRRRPAQAPARCARQAQARQLRPHRAGAARQSARACSATIWCSRSRPARAPRRCSPTCPGTPLSLDRGRRPLRPRAVGEGRQGDGRIRRRMARRPVRRRRQARGQAHAGDALERGAVGARRVLGRGARRAVGAPGADGADPRSRVLRRRSGARNACGARSAAPGNRASAPPTRCCAGIGAVPVEPERAEAPKPAPPPRPGAERQAR